MVASKKIIWSYRLINSNRLKQKNKKLEIILDLIYKFRIFKIELTIEKN